MAVRTIVVLGNESVDLQPFISFFISKIPSFLANLK